MRMNDYKVTLPVLRAAGILFSLAAASFGQQQINLSAGPANMVMPDGSTVPMWGYSCGTLVTGSGATCAPLNPNATGGWSPVVITIPTSASGGLQINLTNNLSFTPTSATTPNTIPTSLVIVGQVGGGLGTPKTVASPAHAAQGVTWSTVSAPGAGPTFNPPPQNPRVQ